MISILSTALVLSSVLAPTLAGPLDRSNFEQVKRSLIKRDTSSFVGVSMPPLGQSCNYAVLAKSGISTVPGSTVNGPIGVSPIAMTAITGFSFTDAGPGPSTSSQITAPYQAHAPESSDGGSPTGSPKAVSDMMTAYNYASTQPASPDSNLVNYPAPYAQTYTDAFGGQIPSGTIFKKGSYRWASTVVIPVGADIYLDGQCGDVFIFFASGAISTGANSNVHLMGSLTSATVFFVTATVLTTGAPSMFNGNVLTGTNAVIGTSGTLNGLAQIQTQIALHMATVNRPQFSSTCQATCAAPYIVTGLPPVPLIPSCTAANAVLATASSCYTNVAAVATSYFAAAGALAQAAAVAAAAPTNKDLQGSLAFASASAAAAALAIQTQAAYGLGPACIGGFTGVAPTPGCTAAQSAASTGSSCYAAVATAFSKFNQAFANAASANSALAATPTNTDLQSAAAASAAISGAALYVLAQQTTIAFGTPCAGAYVGVATTTVAPSAGPTPVPYISQCSAASSVLSTAASCYSVVTSAAFSYFAADYAYSAVSTAVAASPSNTDLQASLTTASAASVTALQAVSSAAQYGLGEPCSGGFHGVSTVSGCSVAESAVATAAVCFGGAFEAATGYFAADQAYSAASRTFAAAQTQLAEAVAASSIALAGVVAQKTIVFGPACTGGFVGAAAKI